MEMSHEKVTILGTRIVAVVLPFFYEYCNFEKHSAPSYSDTIFAKHYKRFIFHVCDIVTVTANVIVEKGSLCFYRYWTVGPQQEILQTCV